MRKRFAMAASVLTLVLVVAAACASSGSTSATPDANAGPTFPITLMIDNNLQGLKAVTVSISRASSNARRLGSVTSGARQSYTYQAVTGEYQLRGVTSTATDEPIVSEKFQVTGPATITWHVQQNTIVRE